jgi:hypothetical protein
MILHKFTRTFRCMMFGWFIFCLSFPLLAVLVLAFEGRPLREGGFAWLAFSAFSFPVVLLGWLLVLFPTDCLVAQTSKLRTPQIAGGIGLLVGPLPFFVLATYQDMHSLSALWSALVSIGRDADSWLYLGGAAITGFASALRLALKYPPHTNA